MRKTVLFALFTLTVLFSMEAFSAQVLQSHYHWSNRGSQDSLQYGRDCTTFAILLDDGESLELVIELLNQSNCCCGEIGIADLLEQNPWLMPTDQSQIVFFVGCLPDGRGIEMIV